MNNTEKYTADYFNRFAQGHLPDYLGLNVIRVVAREVEIEMAIKKHHLAPNGYLHAGSVVTLADTAAGFGTLSNLPADAHNFTTIELKMNFLGTTRSGVVRCLSTAIHMGRTTQVWDAKVYADNSGKTIAQFRCTQMILY